MASSSSSAAVISCREKYDVFLSFRGTDTRDTFTSHLHAALLRKKIETYIDYRFERGDKIGPALLEAIEKSKLSVIIFSKNYASSTWCLDELAHILGCKERYGQIVVPIFYGIDPSHVRKQQESYADAFAQLEERFKDSMDKVEKWRAALKEAADMSGFDNSNKKGTEAHFVEKVVEDVLTKLNRKSSSDLMGLVGIESRIKQIESSLCNDSPDVVSVGIWGMGGIGKTTLADAVFHRLSSKFEASCFLANVREKSEEKDGLNHMRNKLLREILNDESINIGTPSIGSTFVGERLCRTKALIVLDDVNHSSQLERLGGNNVRFGPGSRIIITTRDRSLFKTHVDDDKIYKVEGLKDDEALRLFHLHAFKNNATRGDYTKLSRTVLDYAGGIPLALRILSSLFLDCESQEDWEDELKNLKNFPNQEIQNVLRLSYDRLEKNAKEIFLDIACFLKGVNINVVKRIVDSRGLIARGIRVLIDKSLISISKWNCLEMHDLLQEMGRAIVCEQCIDEPGKRSRLCIAEDVYHVLKNNTGTAAVQAISYRIGKRDFNHADFKKMYNLRFLHVDNYGFGEYSELNVSLDLPDSLSYLYWGRYPLKFLPSKFSPENLVVLHLPYSEVEQLWNDDQILKNLKVMDLSCSNHLVKIPNLSGSLKIEHIELSACERLVQIPSYFQYLDKLTYLGLGGCTSLKYLPEMPGSIKVLHLRGSGIKELPSSVWSHQKISDFDIENCKHLENLPSSRCKLKISGTFSLQGCSSIGKLLELPRNITELDLSGTAIQVLSSSIEFLSVLKKIQLKGCKRLLSLPMSICKLKSLEGLDLTGCSRLKNFPVILECMEHLEFLSLAGTAVKELPSSIQFLSGLKKMLLTGCKSLLTLPTSICKLNSLEALDLSWCSGFENFPEILEPMENLEFLRLSGTSVMELPSSIKFLSVLKQIQLISCTRFVSLPTSICKLKSLERLDLSFCSEFENFPEILEPMKHLEFLRLIGTAVRKLPWSIGNLTGLQTLVLSLCNNLEFVPDSIHKLTNLQSLNFRGCWKLEILPPFSVGMGLVSLKVLNLSCGILKIPDGLVCSTSLRDLDLRESMITSIPASIKQASQLSRLCLINCNKLQSLPELPVLCCLEADGCTLLKTVSSSRTVLTQVWGKYELFRGELFFCNCSNLDENARSNIMADVQLRIMRVATASSKFTKLKDYDECRALATLICPGEKIPNWFNYQNEGSSIKIELPPDWFREGFLGFAQSFVVAVKEPNVRIGCWYKFETEFGESHAIDCPDNIPPLYEEGMLHDDSDEEGTLHDDFDAYEHVFVWHNAFELVEEAHLNGSAAFYNLVTEVSIDFYTHIFVKVKRCGIRLLYAEDGETMLKRN